MVRFSVIGRTCFTNLDLVLITYLVTNVEYSISVGWSSSQPQGYGEEVGVKSKLMNVITSVQTLLRGWF